MTLPSLVLLPGLDGTGLLFGPLLGALPSEVSPIVVSYPADKPLGYSELLPLVLGALPTDRPFVLLGESFSGPLAFMAAEARPAGLVGVVLCASFIRNPHPYVPSVLAAAVRSPVFRLARVAPAVLAGRIREVLRVNVVQQLRACTVPILYLRSRNRRCAPCLGARAESCSAGGRRDGQSRILRFPAFWDGRPERAPPRTVVGF